MTEYRTFLGCLVVLMLCGCSGSSIPSNTADACKIFAEKPRWYRAALNAERRWNISVPILLAVIKKESSFNHHAKPPRGRILGVIPGRRKSSAFGYAQALDETWDDYKKRAKRRGADRDNFADAIDFVGWYFDSAAKKLKLNRNAADLLYITYHDGIGGFQSGAWRKSPWMKDAAQRVKKQASLYLIQLNRCSRGPARSYRFKRN